MNESLQQPVMEPEVELSAALTDRLWQRYAQPVGLIDAAQSRQHYSRIADWAGHRSSLADEVQARYGGMSATATAAGELILAAGPTGRMTDNAEPSNSSAIPVRETTPSMTGTASPRFIQRKAIATTTPTKPFVVPAQNFSGLMMPSERASLSAAERASVSPIGAKIELPQNAGNRLNEANNNPRKDGSFTLRQPASEMPARPGTAVSRPSALSSRPPVIQRKVVEGTPPMTGAETAGASLASRPELPVVPHRQNSSALILRKVAGETSPQVSPGPAPFGSPLPVTVRQQARTVIARQVASHAGTMSQETPPSAATQTPTVSHSESVREIQAEQIVSQVERLMARRLMIERERRGEAI